MLGKCSVNDLDLWFFSYDFRHPIFKLFAAKTISNDDVSFFVLKYA
jgi:hypothetical protein